MSGPTRGPLLARKINADEPSWAVISPNGLHGDEIVAGYVTEGNARLFAAAPALLEALQDLFDYWVGGESYFGADDDIEDKARAAIAAATDAGS